MRCHVREKKQDILRILYFVRLMSNIFIIKKFKYFIFQQKKKNVLKKNDCGYFPKPWRDTFLMFYTLEQTVIPTFTICSFCAVTAYSRRYECSRNSNYGPYLIGTRERSGDFTGITENAKTYVWHIIVWVFYRL